MISTSPSSYTSFAGPRRIAHGTKALVALAVKHALTGGQPDPLLIFDDATGRTIDIDLRGSDDEIVARLGVATPAAAAGAAVNGRNTPDAANPIASADAAVDAAPRGRGRPKLGVVPREVTLLPRHWEWLGMQPGGASVALRKLVETARRSIDGKQDKRRSQERAYHFMSAIAGDLPGFEEASRALFADDATHLGELMIGWPGDIREHALYLYAGPAD